MMPFLHAHGPPFVRILRRYYPRFFALRVSGQLYLSHGQMICASPNGSSDTNSEYFPFKIPQIRVAVFFRENFSGSSVGGLCYYGTSSPDDVKFSVDSWAARAKGKAFRVRLIDANGLEVPQGAEA